MVPTSESGGGSTSFFRGGRRRRGRAAPKRAQEAAAGATARRSVDRACRTDRVSGMAHSGLALSDRSGAGCGATTRTDVTGSAGCQRLPVRPIASPSASPASSASVGIGGRRGRRVKRQGKPGQGDGEVRLIWHLAIARTPPSRTRSLPGCEPASVGRGLHHQLVDEQKRHPGLEIVKQLLQLRLLDFAACDHAEETRVCRRALHIELGRQHIAAEFHHCAGDPLQQRCARDRHRRALEIGRAGWHRHFAGPVAPVRPPGVLRAAPASPSRLRPRRAGPITSVIDVTTTNSSRRPRRDIALPPPGSATR